MFTVVSVWELIVIKAVRIISCQVYNRQLASIPTILYSAIMRFLLLPALVGLLQAEVVVKQLHIQEHGTEYTQTITLDYERNIQTLEVPAHNNIVHSKTIFDFNQVCLKACLVENCCFKGEHWWRKKSCIQLKH